MMLNDQGYLGGKRFIFHTLLTFFAKDKSCTNICKHWTGTINNKILPLCEIALSNTSIFKDPSKIISFY